MMVCRILNAVGLKPMYGSRPKKQIPKSLKKIIDRAVQVKTYLSLRDRAYILNVPDYYLWNAASRMGIRKSQQRSDSTIPILSNSSIYHYLKLFSAMDSGLSLEESINSVMPSTAPKHQSVYQSILDHRKQIEEEVDCFLVEVGREPRYRPI